MRPSVRFSLPLVASIVAALIALPVPAPAVAAGPGVDGRIAYIGYTPVPGDEDGASHEVVFTSNPDGSYPRVVPNTGPLDAAPTDPVWSPDSSRIAFGLEYWEEERFVVAVVNADGTGFRELAEGLEPAWTADGQWITYTVYGPAADEYTIWRVSPAGGEAEYVFDGRNAAWSPDGRKVAFERDWSDVYVRDLETGDEINITPETPTVDFIGDWSPDSSTLVIDSWGDGWDGETLLVSADGSSSRPLVNAPREAAWSPSGNSIVTRYFIEDGPEWLEVLDLDGNVISKKAVAAFDPDWGSAPIVEDTVKPATSSAASIPRVGSALAGSSAPLTLTWSAQDDPGGTGVASYLVQRSVNGGTWTTVADAVTSRSVAVSAGTSSGTVRFRVRAIDRAGNVGGWAYTRTMSPRLVQQTSSHVRFSGTWKTSSDSRHSGGSTRYASTSGKAVSYTFTGRSIALVAPRSPSRGKAKIYVNGTYVATVDLYRSSSQYRAVVWQRTYSTTVTRTVRVVVVGTSGRPRFDADAFVIVK